LYWIYFSPTNIIGISRGADGKNDGFGHTPLPPYKSALCSAFSNGSLSISCILSLNTNIPVIFISAAGMYIFTSIPAFINAMMIWWAKALLSISLPQVMFMALILPFNSCKISYCAFFKIRAPRFSFSRSRSSWRTAVCLLSVSILSCCIPSLVFCMPRIAETVCDDRTCNPSSDATPRITSTAPSFGTNGGMAAFSLRENSGPYSRTRPITTAAMATDIQESKTDKQDSIESWRSLSDEEVADAVLERHERIEAIGAAVTALAGLALSVKLLIRGWKT